jgi:membrane peptidoglycan carboxypeptidase
MSDYKPELLRHPARSRRKRAKANILTWMLAGTIIAVITVVTLVYTYYSTRANLINIGVVKKMPQASILYDYQGRSFSRFFDENRIALPTDQPVPKLLGQAVVATEDRRFYEHGARGRLQFCPSRRRRAAGGQHYHAATGAQQHRPDAAHV